MRKLLEKLGHPEAGLNFIHLAGTNGKGSTAAALDAILRGAGFFSGLYTSPHLVDFRERFRVGGDWVGEKALRKSLAPLIRIIDGMPWKQRPTFFEATTALALKIFREARVDFVVWETGLGGRLDATNVVAPELCILTSLGRDHEMILGKGWRRIGAEKMGILKRGVPVLSARWPGVAQKALEKRAKRLGCAWRVVPALRRSSDTLPLAGKHQRQNLALAVAAGRYLGLPDRIIARGLSKTIWPGRFSILQNRPRLVLDGAHNAEGVTAALQTWTEVFGALPGRLIFGCLKDKPADEMLRIIRRTGAEIWGVELNDLRASDPLSWKIHPVQLFSSVSAALLANRKDPNSKGTLIMGSLVLVGEVLRAMGIKRW
jgi:dihydrofolate synthase/folylpolyglutamate synthase